MTLKEPVAFVLSGLKTWQRLTLPGLKAQYHQRWRLSRPSSGWDRVQILRYNHQVVKPDNEMKVCQKNS